MLVASRKRLPLIRPLCPIHLIPMVVKKTTPTLRRHYCVIKGCECMTKTLRRA